MKALKPSERGARMRASLVFLAYAVITAACAAVAATELSRTDTRLGVLPILARVSSFLVCAGLVYENGMVAAGNFLGPGPLLEQLSYGRYYLHLLAPLATFSGMDIAVAAGVRWAASPPGLLIFAGITVGMMVFATYHMLSHGYQLHPKLEQDLVMYCGLHPKMRKVEVLALVLPVVWLSIAMVILGIASAISRWDDASIWPVSAMGPLLCFVLCSQARHSKALENLGEVFLMSSVVYLQTAVKSAVQ